MSAGRDFVATRGRRGPGVGASLLLGSSADSVSLCSDVPVEGRSQSYDARMDLVIGEFWDESAVRVSVETTGLQREDAGQQGWAEVEIDFLTNDNSHALGKERSPKIYIRAMGDSEISTLAAALEWAGCQLREIAKAPVVPVSIPPSL